VARELELEVVSTADSRGFDKAAKDLKGVKAEADKASKAAKGLGDSFNDTEHDAFDFSAQIAKTQASIKSLSAEFAKSGDRSLLGDVRKQRGFLDQLEKIRKEIEGAGDGGFSVAIGSAAGAGIGNAATQGITRAFGSGSFRTKAIGSLVGLGVVASPLLGAVISGAVAGATLSAGIAGGIFAASKNEEVRTAARAFGTEISHEFFASGDSFVKPTVGALAILQKDFKSLDLEKTFALAAPAVETLAHGVGDFARNLMPGLNSVMAKSPAISDAMAGGLAEIGTSLSDMLTTISQSPGTIEGLVVGFHALSVATEFTGDTLGVLGNAFHGFGTVSAGLTGIIEDLPLGGLADRAGNVNDSLEKTLGISGRLSRGLLLTGEEAKRAGEQGLDPFSAYLRAAAENTDALKVNLSELISETMGIDRATISYEDALDDLTQSFKDNGKSMDVTTEKGRANRTAFLNGVSAAADLRDAQIAAGGSADVANAAYQKQIKKLEAVATKAGVAKSTLDKLAGPYEVSITYRGRVTGHHMSVGPNYGSGAAAEVNRLPRRAAGGPVMAGMSYIVGEKRPEVFTPSTSGYISPRVPQMATGAGMNNITVVLKIDQGLSDWNVVRPLITALRAEVQNSGGRGSFLGIKSF